MAKTKNSKLKKAKVVPSNSEDYSQDSAETFHESLIKKTKKPKRKLSNGQTVADLENISKIRTKLKKKNKLKKESKSLKLLKKRFTSKNGNFNFKKFIHCFLYPVEVQYVSESDEIQTLDDFLTFSTDIGVDSKTIKVSKPKIIFGNAERENILGIQPVGENEQEIDEDLNEELPELEEIPQLLEVPPENSQIQVESISTTASPEKIVPLTQIESPPKVTGTYELYPIKEGSILIMEESSNISFNGVMELTVFHGTVEILGKTLDKTCPPTKLYSMRGSAFLTINNLNVPEDSKENIVNKLHKLGFAYTASNQLVKNKLKENSVLLCCKTLNSKMTTFLKENSAQKLYPENKGSTFTFRNTEDPEWNIFKTNDGWDVLAQDFTCDSKVMLCGGKSVGKSTLLRYLINKLLGKFEEVAVIDLDPGQPEFTMPGCISSLIIRNSVIGPNYTHLSKPEHCLFIPNIYINSNHDTYLACVQELVKVSQFPKIPTIINFMGFTNGFGVNLVASVISTVAPTRVVQIKSSHNAKNYSVDLTPEAVCHYRELLSPEDLSEIDYDLFILKSMNNHNGNWELEPRLVREFCIFTYFSQMLPQNCKYLTEKEVKICSCRLSDVKIIHNGKECDPMAANASLVALCTRNESNKQIFNCHGYGIVRGMSIEMDYVALLTPLSEEELDAVDHLVLGSVGLPPSIYLRQTDEISGLIPYTVQGDLSNFAKAPKRAVAFRKLD